MTGLNELRLHAYMLLGYFRDFLAKQRGSMVTISPKKLWRYVELNGYRDKAGKILLGVQKGDRINIYLLMMEIVFENNGRIRDCSGKVWYVESRHVSRRRIGYVMRREQVKGVEAGI